MSKRRPVGDGMVRKRDDGRWEGRIVIGHRENGEPLFRHIYAKTQKALLDKLHQNIECYRDVELTEDSRMTLSEWLDRWLAEYKAGTVRPGTLKSYRCYIEYYIKPQLGDKQISLISQQDIQRMYRRLKTEGRIREHPEMGHQLSDSMVRHIHSTLHAALKDAVQAHVIPRNPTEGTTAPKPNYKPKRILTRAELDAFLAVVEQDEVWRDFFQTELMTGLRRGEICGLQWSDFDEEGGTLKVCRTLHSQRKGEYTVGETKTNQGMRTIILPHSVTKILRRRKADAISQWIFPDPVKPEDLEAILNCGRLAPTGVNRQAWKFIVATDQKVKDAMADATDYGKFINQAAVVVAVAIGPEAACPFEDAGAATCNMLNAAHALGYGGCWIGANGLQEHPTAQRVAQVLGVPEEAVRRGLLTTTVRGRTEVYPHEGDYIVLIDYAHSPNALENILMTARDFTAGRLICLFGWCSARAATGPGCAAPIWPGRPPSMPISPLSPPTTPARSGWRTSARISPLPSAARFPRWRSMTAAKPFFTPWTWPRTGTSSPSWARGMRSISRPTAYGRISPSGKCWTSISPPRLPANAQNNKGE